MSAKPILFNGDMVRALLEGRKTQTRRVIKPQPPHDVIGNGDGSVLADTGGNYRVTCPYGKPDDYMYVRETWGVGSRPCPREGSYEGIEYHADIPYLDKHDLLDCYRVDPPDDIDLDSYLGNWHPSIHMFRWASRLTLKITSVGVQRVRDISESDCESEGLKRLQDGIKQHFSLLWNSTVKDANLKFAANPWVWVIEFEVIHENVDKVLVDAAYK